MQIKNVLVYTLEQGFVKKDVFIKNGRFVKDCQLTMEKSQVALEAKKSQGDEDTVIDGKGNYLIPGLVDIHFHGCAGYDFSDGTPEALATIGRYELEHGITSICPASMTLADEMLVGICKNALAYHKENTSKTEPNAFKKRANTFSGKFTERPLGSRLCGIHLEGPFISMEKKGAQNPAYIKMPSKAFFERLQEAAGGLVRLITIAPEIEGAEEFIRSLAKEVHISVGHTTSDYDTAAKAFVLGADHVTHFFNAMPGFSHRAPGVFGAAFDAGHVMPELICDGIHIDPSAVRVAFQLFGKERMILISDSMMATGLKDGNYSLGGLPVAVKGNRATLKDGTIAGSVTNLMDCMRKAVSMGIPLETAVRCATYNPAKSIGVEDVCGSIEAGKYGDCVLLSRDDLSTQMVVLGGEVVS